MTANTTLHIVGNGPSVDYFNRIDWPSDDLVIGCNFSDIKYNPNFTVMMDIKPFMKFYQGYTTKIPLVISKRCESFVVNEKKGWDKLTPDVFLLADVIEMTHDSDKPYPMNSGQHATLYGIAQRATTTVVHLWGLDSFWSSSLSSRTDAFVERSTEPRTRPKVAKCWKLYWEQIFAKHSNISFIVHAPVDVEINFTMIHMNNFGVQYHENTR